MNKAFLNVTFPLEEDLRPEKHEFPAGKNLAEALMEISPDRWGNRTFALFYGTIQESTNLAAEEADQVTLKDGDVWHVVVLPGEIITASAIVYTALALTAAGVGLATAKILATIIVYAALVALSIALSYASSMLFRPKSYNSSPTSGDDQPTSLNSLSQPTNMFRPTSRIPEIYGTLRTWPDLIFPSTAYWETINTQHSGQGDNEYTTSVQYARAVYAVGRGRYETANYRFADSEVGTVSATIRKFEPGQTLPPDVKMASPVVNLNRYDLKGPTGGDPWSPMYDIPGKLTDEIWVQFHFPQGMYGVTSGRKVPADDRAMFPITADMRIRAERIDDNGNVLETQEWNNQVNAGTRNELRFSHKHAVNPGRWRVQAAETNNQDYVVGTKNTYKLYKKCALENIVGFRSLTEEERTYNDITVLIVDCHLSSSSVAQNLDNFNTMATRILPTQQGGAPPGVLTEPYPNNLWVTAAIHTLTDPQICNYRGDQIDWNSLIEVQNSLSDYTYTEHEFNGIFDRQMSADEQILQIARKARAVVFFSNSLVTFARDQRRQGVTALFNRRNRFLEPGKTGLTLRMPSGDDADGVEIQWIDAEDGYKRKTYTYPENVTLLNPMTMELIGATHSWEICRRARYEHAVNLYRRRSQPIRVTEEAQLLSLFDRVSVINPWDENVFDGEVLETAGLSLRLSRPLPLLYNAGGQIRLRRADGRETSLIDFIPNTAMGDDWITLSSAPAFSILVPSADQQLGTLFNISSSDNTEAATHWLVAGVELDDSGASIALVEDSDEIFQLSDDLEDPCTDAPPLIWSYFSSQAGNYGGGGFTFTTPVCNPGDILLVVLGATGPNYTAPAGWIQIEKIDSGVTTLGEERSLLVVYKIAEVGEPATHFFSRAGGTLSGGWMTCIAVNRSVGSIVYGGSKVTTLARAVGAAFTLPGKNIPAENALVVTALVAGATIYADAWPITNMGVPALWTQLSHMSWTPGVYPVYAATVYSAKPNNEYTGPTGTMNFNIPRNSDPLNNNLFTSVVFTFHYDPSTGGTLTPRSGAPEAMMASLSAPEEPETTDQVAIRSSHHGN